MADSDVYPPCVRQDLQALLTRMLGGTDFFGAVHALSTSFHPSFFLELDWQELRLDRDYSEGPGIYEVIDDFVFAANTAGQHFYAGSTGRGAGCGLLHMGRLVSGVLRGLEE